MVAPPDRALVSAAFDNDFLAGFLYLMQLTIPFACKDDGLKSLFKLKEVLAKSSLAFLPLASSFHHYRCSAPYSRIKFGSLDLERK